MKFQLGPKQIQIRTPTLKGVVHRVDINTAVTMELQVQILSRCWTVCTVHYV